MSNISTCEAVELVRNAIDPYSMMGISADDMVYASVKRHMLGTCDQQIQNADIVMFKVDSCSHALYNKGKTICNRYDVPFCYIPNVASIPRIEQSMCEQLEEIFS